MILEDEQAVGLALRAARSTLGKTQQEMEAESGICDSTISKIETCLAGEPLPPTTEQYAQALGFRLERRKSYVLVPLRGGARRAPERT